MKTYKILAVCGCGIATSTVAAEKCRESLEKRGMQPVEVLECKVSEVVARAEAYQPDVIVHTADIPHDELKNFKIFRGIQLLTGIGIDALIDQIANYLQQRQEP